jgi:alkylation response protein AidB-like acyl-CoA dehydrogenase
MDIQFTEEQELLRSSVQRLLRDQYNFEARRKIVASEEGFGRKQWEAFAELGLFAAPFSEHVGGLGGGPLSTMIIMQEFGRHLVVEPFFETVALAGGLIENAGSPAQREAYLPQIMAGGSIWAGLGGRTFALRLQQCSHDGAASGRQLCSERHQGGGDCGTLGRQVDRLGANIRWPT